LVQVMNPSYYGLDETSSEAINMYLSSLVGSTLRALQEAGCCRVEEDGRVEPLMPGRIASFYYLHYATMTLFSHAITAHTTHQVTTRHPGVAAAPAP
jgi:activating signal cointegrator complex subunit 3